MIGDAPTQSLLDPDHPLAREAVGTQGVSLCRKQDFFDLYRGVRFDQVSISSSVPAFFALAGWSYPPAKPDFLWTACKGPFFTDPYIRRTAPTLAISRWSFGCDSRRFDRVLFASHAEISCLPRGHLFLQRVRPTPVEEMALGFVQLRHIARKLLGRGVAIDSFAPRIALLVNCGMDFFEEIAKIRAARRLYAKMMRDEFGARDPRSMSIAITSHTSGLSLTAQQPINNVVRGAVQALSLALAGVQALEISAFDEAYRTPSKDAHIVGLRTQQILDLESGVAKVLDPLGGSYFVEALTDQLEARIRARVEEIEAKGDPQALSATGVFREIFHQAMEAAQLGVESGAVPVVGVNVHRSPPEEDTLLREVATSKVNSWRDHARVIERFKRERDVAALRQGLDEVAAAATGQQTSSPPSSQLSTHQRQSERSPPQCGRPCECRRTFSTTPCSARARRTGMSREVIALALMGIDQHENGAIAVARVLREAQMKVDYLGKFNTPASVAEKR